MNAIYPIFPVAAFLATSFGLFGNPITDLTANGTTTIEGPIQIDTSSTAAEAGLWWLEGIDRGIYILGGSDSSLEVPYTLSSGTRGLIWNPKKAAFAGGEVGTNGGMVPSTMGIHSFAFGYNAVAEGSYSFAFGRNAVAARFDSIAIGKDALSDNDRDLAIGSETIASGGDGTVALGYQAIGIGEATIAIGYDVLAVGDFSISIGEGSFADAYSSVALGGGAEASGISSVALGTSSKAYAYSEVGIGRLQNNGYSATTWVPTDPKFRVGLTSGYEAIHTKKNGSTTLSNRYWLDDVVNYSVSELAAAVGNSDASDGVALTVEGHTELKGKLTLSDGTPLSTAQEVLNILGPSGSLFDVNSNLVLGTTPTGAPTVADSQDNLLLNNNAVVSSDGGDMDGTNVDFLFHADVNQGDVLGVWKFFSDSEIDGTEANSMIEAGAITLNGIAGTQDSVPAISISSAKVLNYRETLLYASLDGESPSLRVGNGTASNGLFAPAILGDMQAELITPISIIGTGSSGADSHVANSAMVHIGARIHDGDPMNGSFSPVQNRNILAVRNSTNSPSFVVAADDNVGIGIETPEEKLHVAGGNAKVEGDLEVTGTATISRIVPQGDIEMGVFGPN